MTLIVKWFGMKLIGKSIKGFRGEPLQFVKIRWLTRTTGFSFGQHRPNYVNEICTASPHPTHIPICMMIFSILTYNNYCVSSQAVVCVTKAARTKCQCILGKQRKAFELMQQGTKGNPRPNLPASIHSQLRVHHLPLVGASFLRFYSFPFSISGNQSKTNKPLLKWHRSMSRNLWISESSPLFFIFVVDVVRSFVIP